MAEVKKILLVDDEPDILEFLKYSLEMNGFEVITALNGVDALLSLSQKPDLIILDIMMPKMDGYEVCQRIRENPDFKQTPLMFLTARSSEKDEIRSLRMNCCLSKRNMEMSAELKSFINSKSSPLRI